MAKLAFLVGTIDSHVGYHGDLHPTWLLPRLPPSFPPTLECFDDDDPPPIAHDTRFVLLLSVGRCN
jgi:hypothetical protein